MQLVILDDQTEVRYGHAGKALVLKSKIEALPLRATRKTIMQNLPEESGLAARRMPIIATALSAIAGMWTSRRVNSGMGSASASMIFGV